MQTLRVALLLFTISVFNAIDLYIQVTLDGTMFVKPQIIIHEFVTLKYFGYDTFGL